MHVTSLVANTVFDREFRNADLKIEVDLLNESLRASTPADIAFELIDPTAEKEPGATATATVEALPPGKQARRSVSIRVPNVSGRALLSALGSSAGEWPDHQDDSTYQVRQVATKETECS
jgi:hypothetical protein